MKETKTNLITYVIRDNVTYKAITTFSLCKGGLTFEQRRNVVSSMGFGFVEFKHLLVERYLGKDLIFSSLIPTEKEEEAREKESKKDGAFRRPEYEWNTDMENGNLEWNKEEEEEPTLEDPFSNGDDDEEFTDYPFSHRDDEEEEDLDNLDDLDNYNGLHGLDTLDD